MRLSLGFIEGAWDTLAEGCADPVAGASGGPLGGGGFGARVLSGAVGALAGAPWHPLTGAAEPPAGATPRHIAVAATDAYQDHPAAVRARAAAYCEGS